MANCEIFEAGDVALESGAVLPAVRIAYRTLGKMNAARSNAIAYPTHYSGTHDSNAWAIGPGLALDPKHYFIIVPNMLGNGLSSSPSNTPARTTNRASRWQRSATTSCCSIVSLPSFSTLPRWRWSSAIRWARSSRGIG